MANLPTVGSGAGTWGTDLNAFLSVGHDADGTHTKTQVMTDLDINSSTDMTRSFVNAWGSVNAGGGTAANNYNVASSSVASTNQYTINWTTAFADANYAIVITPESDAYRCTIGSVAAGSVVIRTWDAAGVAAPCAFRFIAIGTRA